MFTKTVQKIIRKNPNSKKYHQENLCSSCKNANWTTTLNSTYANSGTMQDYLRFLMGDAEEKGDAQGFYRCYCLVQHEYLGFAWFDAEENAHIVNGCDSFAKCVERKEQKS